MLSHQCAWARCQAKSTCRCRSPLPSSVRRRSTRTSAGPQVRAIRTSSADLESARVSAAHLRLRAGNGAEALGGVPPPFPTRPPPGLRAARSPARWRGTPRRPQSTPPGPPAPQPCVPSDCSPLPSICSCRSHAAPGCGRQVSYERVLPMSPHSVLGEDLRACPPGEAVPSAMHTSSLELDHLSGFKRRAERKCREVSGHGFGHQDKRMASVERQAVVVQCLQ